MVILFMPKLCCLQLETDQVLSKAIAGQTKPLKKPVVIKHYKVASVPKPHIFFNYNLMKFMPTKDVKVNYSITYKTHVCWLHNDLKVPSFDEYRKSSTLDPTSKNRNTADGRRVFPCIWYGGGTTVLMYCTKELCIEFVSFMAASKDGLALAKTEINLDNIDEGLNMTYKWRGMPLFVRHRTSAEIDTESNVDISTLRDPETDSDRVKIPEWLVVIDVCTHLGCVPLANAGDWGGYYCPCRGSHFDSAERVRKGPAPTNLAVPPYFFMGNLLVVG